MSDSALAAESEAVAAAEVDEARAPGRRSRLAALRGRLTPRLALRSGVLQQLGGLLAFAGVVLALGLNPDVPELALAGALAGTAVGAAPHAVSLLRRGRGPAGSGTVERVLLALTPLLLRREDPRESGLVCVLIAAAILAEPALRQISRAAVPYAAHLGGVAVRNTPLIAPSRIYAINTAAAVLIAVAAPAAIAAPALLEPPLPLLALPGGIALTLTLVSLGDAAARVLARHRADTRLGAAVAAHAPAFILHWDAPPGTEYQVAMWLPHLAAIGAPFIVVVRNPRTLRSVAALTEAPVLVRQHPADLDAAVAPTVRAAFYVNNAARNTHLVRFTGITHVQLNHGESDKAPSYSPVFRLYDRDFVAGQAAVDRFAANGVRVPDRLFTIVGRPQVADITVGPAAAGPRTALYAPTWAGANADSDYCSLPLGVTIAEALIARGITVIFRPHPYTDRTPAHAREAARVRALLAEDSRLSGRPHRFGADATETPLTELMNSSAMLVADISSVVPDFLHSERPLAVVAVGCAEEEFRASFPIARAAYVVDGGALNLNSVLDAMAGADPLQSARISAKRYFLGASGAEEADARFLAAAREIIADGQTLARETRRF